MRGNMHLALGITGGMAAAIMLSSENSYLRNLICPETCYTASLSIGLLAGSMVGSLFPDIDIPGSLIGKPVAPLSRLLNRMFGHRGFLHTPASYILLWALVSWKFSPTGMTRAAFHGFLYGAALHLLQDMMTEGGVMLLYPCRFRFRIFKVPSGHPFNIICTVVATVGLWGLALMPVAGLAG